MVKVDPNKLAKAGIGALGSIVAGVGTAAIKGITREKSKEECKLKKYKAKEKAKIKKMKLKAKQKKRR